MASLAILAMLASVFLLAQVDILPHDATANPWSIGGMLALLVWAEIRILPLAADGIGWLRALADKAGVTAEDATARRPTLSVIRRRGTAGLLFLFLAIGVGCVPQRWQDSAREVESAWSTFKVASQPAEGVDRAAWDSAVASMTSAIVALSETK